MQTITTTKSNLLFNSKKPTVGIIKSIVQIQILILLLSFPSSFSTRTSSSSSTFKSLAFVRDRFHKAQKGGHYYHHLSSSSLTRDWNIHLEKIQQRRSKLVQKNHHNNKSNMASVLRQRKNVDKLNRIRGGSSEGDDTGINTIGSTNATNVPITTTNTTNTTTISTTQDESKPLMEDSSPPSSSSSTSSTTTATTTTTTTTTSSYKPSKVRSAFFPIYGKEVNKFILMGCIKFFVIMALTLTRDTKDTLVVTQCGAEAIAFLKIYGVLPAATGFIALYSKMSSIFEKKPLFYITCIPFFVFFFLFDALLYPNRHVVQPSVSFVQSLIGGSQGGAMEIVSKIISNWTSALYFVVAELYSSVSVGILFWQFANDVVSVDEAKRFYPLFAQMGGLAPILAGQYAARFASHANSFENSMHRLTVAVLFAGIMICIFYHLSTSFIEKEQALNASKIASSTTTTPATPTPKKKKGKMSMTESIKFLTSSQYLRLIGMLVLGYGLSINFTEIMWKSLLKKKYPNPLDYQRFIGNFSSAVGFATCIVILFGVHVIRVLGWRVGAMATPAIMAILAIPFFICIFLGIDNPARLSTAVALGTAQSLMSKTSKYALFDPTTQMAYIPLDEESKVKGKAAIDVLGSRLGKSGGSLIQQGLVFLFGNIINASAAVSVIFYSVLIAWLSAANRLSGLFMAKTEMQKAEKQGENN